MARVEPRTVSTRDGTCLVVRHATREDGAAHAALLRDIHATSEHLVTRTDERDDDLAREAEKLATVEASAEGLVLVAQKAGNDRGNLVGTLEFRGHAQRRLAHVGWLAMGVRSDARGRGVGTALLTALLDWARAHPTIEKVSLGVFSTNEAGLRLYRRMGFIEEGRRVREFRLAPGVYADDVMMYRWVKDRV